MTAQFTVDDGDIRPATSEEITALPDGTPHIDVYRLADYPATED